MNFKGLLIGMCALAGVAAQNADAVCLQGADSSGAKCFTLYAGQNIDAGTVCVTIVQDKLQVTYTTTGGWELTETHLWAGTTVQGWPQTRKGNPIPGQFPYACTGLPSTSCSILVPLELGCEETWYLAAHAAVRKALDGGGYETQTGWSAGTSMVDRGNWGTYSSVGVTCVCGGTVCDNTCHETAFAKSTTASTCFISIDDDGDTVADEFNRWGWTNGPLIEGDYSFELWAAAGQCNLAAGTLVGNVTVAYHSGTATITYNITDAQYSLGETHAYAGVDLLPENCTGPPTNQTCKSTVAPGQYPQTGTASSYTFTGLSGSIYVVAHANVEGFEPNDDCSCDPIAE